MILQRTNFEIPARFTFQPYSAEWQFVNAETLEWVEEPKLRPIFPVSVDESQKTWMRVRIEMPEPELCTSQMIGLDPPSRAVLMDRASIPPDVIQPHENCHNTPDASGRSFQVLICTKPEFKDSLWALRPGEVTKNAWIMRDEFLRLQADPELGWIWCARQFLNKWGLWESSIGFTEDRGSKPIQLTPASATLPKVLDVPDFVLVMPHLLKKQQDEYGKALLPSNRLRWLRSHPLSLETGEEFPFFRVRRSYCRDVIEATITIDHLAEIRFGICKRCHTVFEKEKKYKMSYCSRTCANAASVARFREKQRKPTWTAAKIARLLSSKKGAKRNAKS
jgi:hypothetical protein